MSLFNELEKIGLSEKEAKVYLAALELGKASVQDISKKAKVNRATTYVILDSLIDKGLCSTYSQKNKTFYVAESPEVLDSIFEVQKKNIEEKQKQIKKVMPQLRLINNDQKDKPTVRFFEGKEGVLSMFSELFSGDTKKIRILYSEDLLAKKFTPKERYEARKKRLDKNIKTKALYTYKSGNKVTSSDGERIKLDEKEFPITSDFALFDDKVRIASLGNRLSGVIIQDKEISNTLKTLFDLAWEGAQAREKKRKK